MTKIDMILSDLLTGNEDIDAKLRAAFDLGVRHGEDADRTSIAKSTQITTTHKILSTLMRVQRINLETAMTMLQIPKKEREIYRKIFGNRERQKAEKPRA